MANHKPIKFKNDPSELKEKYDVFKTLTFGQIANGLSVVPKECFYSENDKLNIEKFFNFLVSKGFNKDYTRMRTILFDIAPLLGIVNRLKLTSEERQDLVVKEKIAENLPTIDELYECEIPEEASIDTDYVLRSMEGDTETVYYRVPKYKNESSKAREHRINVLKFAYVLKYGDRNEKIWTSYLNARPATKGHIEKFGKSLTHTKDVNPVDIIGKND